MEPIEENRLIQEAFERLNEAVTPIERTVIFEKFRRPVISSAGTNEEEHIFRMFGGFVEMCWYDSSGNLHSFNGMPSRIAWDSRIFVEANWHKNGVPYRKNFGFNKMVVAYRENFYRETGQFVVNNKKTTEFHWHNKRGELHSFNDMPALINVNGIFWYRSGKLSRMAHELPCSIGSNGNMTFCKNKDDSPETVNFPFSVIHYGEVVKVGLSKYERFVEFPIRKLLTL